MHGHGTCFSNGTKCVGEFQNDLAHGEATEIYSDGSTYVGELKKGKSMDKRRILFQAAQDMSGIQTKENAWTRDVYFSDGLKYVGEFQNGLPNGKATETTPNGEKYVGEFKQGKRHGHGTLAFPDGATYVGIQGREKAWKRDVYLCKW